MSQPAPVYKGRLMRKPKPELAMVGNAPDPVKSIEDEAKETARRMLQEARERAESEAKKIIRNAHKEAEEKAEAGKAGPKPAAKKAPAKKAPTKKTAKKK